MERALTVQRTEREKARRHMLCPAPTSPDWVRAGADRRESWQWPVWSSHTADLLAVITTNISAQPSNNIYFTQTSHTSCKWWLWRVYNIAGAAVISLEKIKSATPLVLLQSRRAGDFFIEISTWLTSLPGWLSSLLLKGLFSIWSRDSDNWQQGPDQEIVL